MKAPIEIPQPTKTDIKLWYLAVLKTGDIGAIARAFYGARQMLMDMGFPINEAAERVMAWHNGET